VVEGEGEGERGPEMDAVSAPDNSSEDVSDPVAPFCSLIVQFSVLGVKADAFARPRILYAKRPLCSSNTPEKGGGTGRGRGWWCLCQVSHLTPSRRRLQYEF
jgi:hypothetical protein